MVIRPPPGVRSAVEVTRPSNFFTEATSNFGSVSMGVEIGAGGARTAGIPGAGGAAGAGGFDWGVGGAWPPDSCAVSSTQAQMRTQGRDGFLTLSTSTDTARTIEY